MLVLCYIPDKMDTEMCKELGEFKVDLDGRFSSVRTRETNLGMLYCLMALPRLRHLVARIAKLGSHKVVSVTALVTILKHYYWLISL